MTLVLAHRGVHDVERENTLRAFSLVRDVGAAGAELDVRATKDGQLVVHHDDALNGLIIDDTKADQLPPYVPSLAAALDALRGLVVNVEIKPFATSVAAKERASAIDNVLATISDLSDTRILVSSFDLAICDDVHRLAPPLDVGWLVWNVWLEDALNVASTHELSAVNPSRTLVDDASVARASSLGLNLNVWTVNEEIDLARMFNWGVSSVITDQPALALALAARR